MERAAARPPAPVLERNAKLWREVRRGLLLIIAAIDAHFGLTKD
jgi:hypothetical protein